MLSRRSTAVLVSAVAGVVCFTGGGRALADVHTAGVPVLNSDPGAPFTLYLDVAGFNYTGQWSTGEISLPGSTPALNLNGEASNPMTFSATDVNDIKTIWQRVAQSYSIYNINVTTVDPAVAAGQAGTDLARQQYYDNTPDLEHMVIGSQIRTINGVATNWYSNGADGVSGVGVFSKVAGDNGGTVAPGSDSPPDVSHTNWMFAQSTGEVLGAGSGEYIGAVASHENGHAVGLSHQSDIAGTTIVNEYANGDGRYTPIIGEAAGATRVAWRSGPSDNGTTQLQNDIAVTLATNVATVTSTGIPTATLLLTNDGIGHTRLTATPLALTGTAVNPTLAKGVIVPSSSSNPQPTLVSDSTQDYFSFTSNGVTPISLTATDGTEFLLPGVADGNGTLQSTLTILNAMGMTVATATEDASTLFETYNGTLPAGTYDADVASIGGHAEDDTANPTFNPSEYYNVGAFFLTGSGFATTAVPEPTVVAALLVGGLALVGRRRRSARRSA